jgi:hypothetical protein
VCSGGLKPERGLLGFRLEQLFDELRPLGAVLAGVGAGYGHQSVMVVHAPQLRGQPGVAEPECQPAVPRRLAVPAGGSSFDRPQVRNVVDDHDPHGGGPTRRLRVDDIGALQLTKRLRVEPRACTLRLAHLRSEGRLAGAKAKTAWQLFTMRHCVTAAVKDHNRGQTLEEPRH